MDAVALSHVHEGLRYIVHDGASFVVPPKAYQSSAWMASHGAKPLRMMAELIEPPERFAAAGVEHTILFFGSARAKSPEEHSSAMQHAKVLADDPNVSAGERISARAALARLEKTEWMTECYTGVENLARLLTKWSMGRIGSNGKVPFIVSTGGGPGLMEAANRG